MPAKNKKLLQAMAAVAFVGAAIFGWMSGVRHAESATGAQPVGPGIYFTTQSSQPAPVGKYRDWFRTDGERMISTASNVDLPVDHATALTSDVAITQYMIVKLSTTANRVVPLAAGDNSLLLAGVALLGAGGAGTVIPVSVPNYPTLVLNDGTGAIAAGDVIEPSPTVSGYVHKGSTDPVCVAQTAAAASVGATFTCR